MEPWVPIQQTIVFLRQLLRPANLARLTARFPDDKIPVGGVVWSNNGKLLAYNRYMQGEEGRFLQIFVLRKI